MAKKKKKNNRSYLEAQKAQSSQRPALIEFKQEKLNVDTTVEMMGVSKNSLKLPIEQIKKDSIKNIIFAVFAVSVLIVLSYTSFGYSQLTWLLNF